MAIVRSLKRFIIALGQTMDPFRDADYERYLPKEFRGKTVEQRAAHVIAESFQEGIRQAKIRRPELSRVQETSLPTAHAT